MSMRSREDGWDRFVCAFILLKDSFTTFASLSGRRSLFLFFIIKLSVLPESHSISPTLCPSTSWDSELSKHSQYYRRPISLGPTSTDNARTPTLPPITIAPTTAHLLQAMGKLIKNHWARLIILTAAACTSFLPTPLPHSPLSHQHPLTKHPLHRPNRRLNLRLLLAETLLGLPDHEPRSRRPTRPDPPDHQPAPRPPRPLLGMAPTALHHRRHLHPDIQQQQQQ